MKTTRQFDAINVVRHAVDVHNPIRFCHDFYEFIFIKAGTGIFERNGQKTLFDSGDVFFVSRNEPHIMEATMQAEIIIVRITENAKMVLKGLIDSSGGMMVPLSKARSPLNYKISLSSVDEKIAGSIYEVLLTLNNHPVINTNLFFLQISCLITVFERNLSFGGNMADDKLQVEPIDRILKHINKYIKHPDLLTLEYLSEKFNMPLHRLSIYFKKNMNRPIKNYIMESRLKLIGQKLNNSDDTISQIGYEFGYVDESHFYKSFKKFYGMSPSEYRKNAH